MTSVIIDYGRGNLFSLEQAFRHIGEACRISADPAEISAARRLILPGVGAFEDGMNGLRERGLVGPIVAAAAAGTPLLGICLGMQLLADEGEEFGRHPGLGVVGGTVRRIPDGDGGVDHVRIPNVGWRRLDVPAGAGFIPVDAGMVYFVHSFHVVLADAADVAATIRINGANVTAALRRANVFGCQFHPEKSGEAGLAILKRFLELSA